VHDLANALGVPVAVAAALAAGASALAARADHVHSLGAAAFGAAPPDADLTAAAAGAALLAARSDHRHKIADTGWQAPAYQNGWLNYDNTYGPAGYRRIGGITYLRGLVRSGSLGQVIYTLPAGYRPGVKTLFAVHSGAGLGRLDVGTDGAVIHVSGSNDYYAVNVSFPADL
jgi:hypothetical protein